jgi:hypothetical protein
MFDLKKKERVKQFLFCRQALYAPNHASKYHHRSAELREVKRRYRKILRQARAKIGPGYGDYHTIYLAYRLGNIRNTYDGWKRDADGGWKVKARGL